MEEEHITGEEPTLHAAAVVRQTCPKLRAEVTVAIRVRDERAGG